MTQALKCTVHVTRVGEILETSEASLLFKLATVSFILRLDTPILWFTYETGALILVETGIFHKTLFFAVKCLLAMTAYFIGVF